MLQRRSFLATGLVGMTAGMLVPNMAWAAANTEKRFVFIIMRGAADGLEIVAPTGDPHFVSTRGDLAQAAFKGHKLNDFFTLHPALDKVAGMYAKKQAGFFHAVYTGYGGRSHFDGQNCLETGETQPYSSNVGWLNRLLKVLPKADADAIAVGPAVPLTLRGPIPVASYDVGEARHAGDGLRQRLTGLYAEDQQLRMMWDEAERTDKMGQTADNNADAMVKLGATAASLMKGPQGARVIMLDLEGWDTHQAQLPRLKRQLVQFDTLIGSLRDNLGDDWSNTLVLAASEFGRTARYNGTAGTDHGTASAAYMFGGSLPGGGTVSTDWPGLAPSQLFQDRDLKPTGRIEDVMVKALSAHYGMDPARLKRAIYPDLT